MDTNEIFNYLGLSADEVKDLDTFKQKFDGSFVRLEQAANNQELVKKITGQALGSIETKVKQTLKESGIEFESGDLKDKKVEDIVQLGISKMNKSNAELAQRLKDLKESKDTIPKTEYANLEKQYSKAANDLKQLQTMNSSLSEKLTNVVKQSEEKAKGLKMKYAMTSLMGKVPLSEKASPAEKIGFEHIVKSKFKFDINDNDQVEVRDKEGNLIPNPAVAGTFMSAEEVLKNEAAALKLLKVKDGNRERGGYQRQTPPPGGEDAPRRPLHPSRRR